MNVNEVVKRLKVMLSAQSFKFAEATLVDGTEVYTEGELEVGAILFVRAGEGVSDDPFAPAGKHELTSGEIVTVGENGEITEIDKAAEESLEEDDKVEEEMEEVEVAIEVSDEVAEEAVQATEDLLSGIAELVAPFTEEIAVLKEEVIELTKRFEKMAAEPAAPKVSNTFSQIKMDHKSTVDSRSARLAEMRKK